jgi:hypothetical protein
MTSSSFDTSIVAWRLAADVMAVTPAMTVQFGEKYGWLWLHVTVR